MPNAHNKAKMTGDTHLPDVESDLQESMNDDAGGRGSAKAGELKDRDAKTSNSYGHTRDSGEGGPSNR